MADPWEIASGIGAVASVGGAWAVYRGQTRQVDYELARTLHLDLTSGEVAIARDVLTNFRLGRRPYSPDVLSAYFTVLWCFERIFHGRRSMIRSRLDRWKSSAPVRFLDDALCKHVASWERNLPALRSMLVTALDESHGGELHDKGLTTNFEKLAQALHASGVMPSAGPSLGTRPAQVEPRPTAARPTSPSAE